MSMSAIGWLHANLGLDVTGELTQVVQLNVGGMAYTCLRQTLLEFGSSGVIKSILECRGRKSEDGSLVVDRDGTTFRHVLNFMRMKTLILPDKFDEWDLLLDDSRYFELKLLEESILGHYEYQKRTFRRNLPPSLTLQWVSSNASQRVINLSVALPSFVLDAKAESILHQGQNIVHVNDAVTVLMSVYGFNIEHWRSEAPNTHTIFFVLGKE